MASTTKIKGITIEIGGDTNKLTKSLKEVDKDTKKLNTELKGINSLLKFDSKNVELLSQKNKLLIDTLQNTKDKQQGLNKLLLDVDSKKIDLTEQEYRDLQREIVHTKQQISNIETQIVSMEKVHKKSVGDMSKQIDDFAEKSKNVGKSFSVVSGGIVAIGGASIVAFNEVDDGMDTILKKTGATGEQAKGLEKIYENLSGKVNASFGEIGISVGEVSTRLGFTGDDLEQCSEDFLKFAKINEVEVGEAVRLVTRAMGDAGIENKDYNQILDAMTASSQKGGIEISQLAESVTKYGAPMRALGYDTNESIAIFASWEQAGVNTEIAFSGMKIAIGKWSKEGKDARVEFSKTLEKIEQAPNISEATGMAIEAFGQKAGPDLADAIYAGRFEFEDMLQAIENSDGLTTDTFDGLVDGADASAIASNSFKLAIGSVGSTILTSVTPILEKATIKLKLFNNWWKSLDTSSQSYILTTAIVIAALGPLLIIIGTLASSITKIINLGKSMKGVMATMSGGFNKLKTATLGSIKSLGSFIKTSGLAIINFGKMAIQAGISTASMLANKVAMISSTVATNVMAIAQGALNLVMSLNPISLIIIAIAALIASLIALWMNCEEFRKFVTDMFNGYILIMKTVGEFLINAFLWVVEVIIIPLATIIANFFIAVYGFFVSLFTTIKTTLLNACIWLNDNVVKPVVNVFVFMFNTISTFFEKLINGMISGFQGFINFFIDGINSIINGVNDAGEIFGIEINPVARISLGNISLPKLPMLRSGGSISEGGSAIAGEAGPELVSMMDGKTYVRPLNNSENQTLKNQSDSSNKTEINFNGNYKFNDKSDIDYFLNQAGKKLKGVRT